MADTIGRLQVVVEAVDKLTGPMKGMSGAVDGLKGRMMLAIDPVNLMSRGFDVMKKTLGEAIKTTAEFEQSMKTVQAISGATSDQMAILNDLVRSDKVGGLGYTAREAADSLYYLVSAGYDADKAAQALEGTLTFAAATQGDLTEATKIVLSTLNQFQMDAGDAMKVADLFAGAINNSQATMDRLGTSMSYIGAIAHSFDQDLATMTAAMGLLYDAGIDASRAGTGVRQAMAALATESTKTSTILARYGLTFDDVNISTNDFADIMDALSPMLENTGDLLDLFGKRAGPQMVTLVQAGGDAIRDFRDEIGITGVASVVASAQLDTFQGTMKQFEAAVEEAKIETGEVFIPVLTDMVTAFMAGEKQTGQTRDALTAFTSTEKEASDEGFNLGQTIVDAFNKMWGGQGALLDITNSLLGVKEEMKGTSEVMGRGSNDIARGLYVVKEAADEATEALIEYSYGGVGTVGPLASETQEDLAELHREWSAGITAVGHTWTEVRDYFLDTGDVIASVMGQADEGLDDLSDSINATTDSIERMHASQAASEARRAEEEAAAAAAKREAHEKEIATRHEPDEYVPPPAPDVTPYTPQPSLHDTQAEERDAIEELTDTLEETEQAIDELTDAITEPTPPPAPELTREEEIALARAGVEGYQFGGVVPRTGLAYLHAGEQVIPAGETNFHGGVSIHIHGNVGNKSDAVQMLEEAFREVAARSGARMKWGVG